MMAPLALYNGAGTLPAPAYSNAAGGGVGGVRQIRANPHGNWDNAAGGFRHPFSVTLPTGRGAREPAPDRRGSGGLMLDAGRR